MRITVSRKKARQRVRHAVASRIRLGDHLSRAQHARLVQRDSTVRGRVRLPTAHPGSTASLGVACALTVALIRLAKTTNSQYRDQGLASHAQPDHLHGVGIWGCAARAQNARRGRRATVQAISQSAWRGNLLLREAVHVKNVGKHIFIVATKLRSALHVTRDHTRLVAIPSTPGLTALLAPRGTVASVPGRKLSALLGLQVPAGVLFVTHAATIRCSVKRARSLAVSARQDHSLAVVHKTSARSAPCAPREVSVTDRPILSYARQESSLNLGSIHVISVDMTTSTRTLRGLLNVPPVMLVRTQQEDP